MLRQRLKDSIERSAAKFWKDYSAEYEKDAQTLLPQLLDMIDVYNCEYYDSESETDMKIYDLFKIIITKYDIPLTEAIKQDVVNHMFGSRKGLKYMAYVLTKKLRENDPDIQVLCKSFTIDLGDEYCWQHQLEIHF